MTNLNTLCPFNEEEAWKPLPKKPEIQMNLKGDMYLFPSIYTGGVEELTIDRDNITICFGNWLRSDLEIGISQIDKVIICP